ncbi:MAG: ATP-binding protein [Bacilli bacterium]|jgi:AAA15 family ATPase/GTPase|nr:ATP-binding protein [Bacilli bacterium]
MKAYLLRATTCGIRNIVNPVTIDFYNTSNLKKIEPYGNNIRAVYGANGSGKTALILSFLFAQNLMTKSFYLKSKELPYFENLVNKKTKSFSFSCTFAMVDEEKDNKIDDLLSYQIELKENNGKFQIEHEKLSQNKAGSLNGETTPILESNQGILQVGPLFQDDFWTLFRDKTRNLLSDSSFVSLFGDFEKDDARTSGKAGGLALELLASLFFAVSLEVYVQNEDIPFDYYMTPTEIENYRSMSPEDVKSLFVSQYLSPNALTKTIRKETYASYERYIARLTQFLQLFKPSLKAIQIDKKEDPDHFICSNTLVYPDYSVSESYESTGIKKLISLFPLLDAADKGRIVFIDELDANLSGVYLEKVIQFLSRYGKGQLLFTAHSLDPMHYLSQFGKSIYFLGEDNIAVPWIKNGNYKPYLLYPEGMIEGSLLASKRDFFIVEY